MRFLQLIQKVWSVFRGVFPVSLVVRLLDLLVSKTSHLIRAVTVASWFQKIFGDRYFIEVQDNGLDLQRQVTAAAIDLSNEMGIPPVATCDCHYVNREDAEAQDILLCVNTGRFRNDCFAYENGYDRVLSEESLPKCTTHSPTMTGSG